MKLQVTIGSNRDFGAGRGAQAVGVYLMEDLMDSVLAELQHCAQPCFPEMGELRTVRVVGHTPKNDQYIYDIVVEFSEGSKRVAARLYRSPKGNMRSARESARREFQNLQHAYAAAHKKKLSGVPQPIGDLCDLGAVVTEKISGLPLQSLIMKAALLPRYADHGILKAAAGKTGEWLRGFHRATADMPEPFEGDKLLQEIEDACLECKGEGLDDEAIRTILTGAESILTRNRKQLPCSAVLNDFTPLNVIVSEEGIGIADYSRMKLHGSSFVDVAQFLASVEALEKYPFCDRHITTQVQDEFLRAYGAGAADLAILRVMKMRALLGIFAQGRVGKESAQRKKVMWATVMKQFIHHAAQRSLAPAA